MKIKPLNKYLLGIDENEEPIIVETDEEEEGMFLIEK